MNNTQLLSSSRQFFCQKHQEPITNYSTIELKPLCPECISEMFQTRQVEDQNVDSLKNVKTNCSKKVKMGILQLNGQLESSEIRYLLNPQGILDEGYGEIMKCKQQIQRIIDFHFDQFQITFKAQVQENVLKASDLTYIFENIKQSVFELEQLASSLETGNTIHAISKICQLDLKSLVDKFKTDIHKIVDSRDLDPIKISINSASLGQLKSLLNSIATINKTHSHFHSVNQQGNINKNRSSSPPNANQFGLNNFNQSTQQGFNPLSNDPFSTENQLKALQQQQYQMQQQYQQQQQQLTGSGQRVPQGDFGSSGIEGKRLQFDQSGQQARMLQPNQPIVPSPQNNYQQSFNPQQKQLNSEIHVLEHFNENVKERLVIDIDNQTLYGINLDQYRDGNQSSSFKININEELPLENSLIVLPNGDILLIGGLYQSTKKISNEIKRLVIAPNKRSVQIETIGVLSDPRYGHSAVQLNDKIYVIGGFNLGGEVKSEVEMIILGRSKIQVEKIQPCLSPCARPALAVLQGKYIIKIGGVNQEGELVQYLEMYDVANNVWENIDPVVGEEIVEQFNIFYGSGCIAINDKDLVIFGGRNTDGQDTDLCFYLSFQGTEAVIKNIAKYPLPYPTNFTTIQPVIYQNQVVFINTQTKNSLVAFNGESWINTDV